MAAAREVWWLLLLLSAVVSFGAYMMNLGIQRLGAASAAVVATVEPLFTLFFAGALLGEWLAPLQIVGGVLILGSAALRAWRQWRRAEPAAAEAAIPEPGDPAPTATRRARLGYFWLVLNMVGVSLFIILTRAIFRETSLSSLDINFWRYLAATPLMWLLIFTALSHAAPATADPHPTEANTTANRWALIALGVLFAIYSVITAIALQHIIAGLFGIIFLCHLPDDGRLSSRSCWGSACHGCSGWCYWGRPPA